MRISDWSSDVCSSDLHADRLRPHHVPFIEAQGAIVDAAWQAETIFSERNLSPMVTARHSTDLRNGLMALVNKEHRVFGKIFEQGGRRLTWQAASEETRIILDARATARRGDHLQIEIGALFQPLRLQQSSLGGKFLQSFRHFEATSLHRLLQRDRKSTRLNHSHSAAS